MFYAVLDENNVCYSISTDPDAVMQNVAIEEYDVGLLGAVYEDDKWIFPEPEPEEPTEEEIYQAQVLLNQADILSNQVFMEEALAAILLEQVENEEGRW